MLLRILQAVIILPQLSSEPALPGRPPNKPVPEKGSSPRLGQKAGLYLSDDVATARHQPAPNNQVKGNEPTSNGVRIRFSVSSCRVQVGRMRRRCRAYG